MANVLEKLYVRVLWAIVALAKQSGCRLSRNPEFSLEQSKRTAEAIAERFYFPEMGPLINDVLFHSEKKQFPSLIAQALALLAGISDTAIRESLKLILKYIKNGCQVLKKKTDSAIFM